MEDPRLTAEPRIQHVDDDKTSDWLWLDWPFWLGYAAYAILCAVLILGGCVSPF